MVAADAQLCRRIARSHARTFYLASLFLPRAKRRGTLALYAFCRVADDLVDDAVRHRRGAEQESDDDTRDRLNVYRRSLDAAYDGQADQPIFREIAWTAARFALPRTPLHELLDGVEMDLETTRYATWSALERYCQAVASSVGEMCACVFGVAGGPETARLAVTHARTLGTAMQLTNILRDVGEDARRGRCYLPEDELAAHGLTPGEVLDGTVTRHVTAWRAFMRMQVGRARTLYAEALPGISLLAPDAQRCASACALGYARILDVMERNGFDSFTRRAVVSWPERSRVLLQCWLRGAAEVRHAASPGSAASGADHHAAAPA